MSFWCNGCWDQSCLALEDHQGIRYIKPYLYLGIYRVSQQVLDFKQKYL